MNSSNSKVSTIDKKHNRKQNNIKQLKPADEKVKAEI